MDAAYLQKNIADALNEALTSMAIKHPEDEAEFLGRFLLKYGERKNVKEQTKKNVADVEEKLAAYTAAEEEKQKLAEEQAAQASSVDGIYNDFLASLPFISSSKQAAMQEVVNFIETRMNVPAAYIALKRVSGETETLNYVAAGPSQGHVVGQKLVKVVVDPDAEDAPTRQGVSFECLKIPEAPEEEEAPAEDEDPDAPKVEKVAPVAMPLVVENVMREKQCKFFGIPKLGAFVAIPCSYQSLDNEGGCVLNPGEGEAPEPKYELVRTKAEFVIGIDSIGKYRLFSQAEIEKIQALGAGLIKAFERMEAAQGEAQLAFWNDSALQDGSAAVSDVTAKLGDTEAAALAEVAAAMGGGGGEDGGEPAEEGGEPAPGAELLRPARETEAVCASVSQVVADGAVGSQINLLKGHVLPLPAAANNLLFACCCLLGEPLSSFSECGGPSWEVLRNNLLGSFTTKIAEYNPSAALTGLVPEHTVAKIKEFCEANNLADASALPPTLPALGVLSSWLQKALAAREAACAYQLAANQVHLEIVG